jgi:GNAT superfamily N-acetyltransferase
MKDGNVVIEPMTEELILWRCLHFGPLSCSTIEEWPADSEIPFERYRERNKDLLLKLTRTYGACAIVARDGDDVVGMLRFYPREVWKMEGAGELCLQQDHPAGPVDGFADADFPTLEQMADKTLVVHCMMSGSSQLKENPYLRKGIGSRMVKALIPWAADRGWERIEADAFEDLPIIYEITGSAGPAFWQKLGFSVADRHPHPYLQQPSEFLEKLEAQAESLGIDPERAKDTIIMRLDLQ